MSGFNLDGVEIFNDELSNAQILNKLAQKNDGEEPFHILDVGNIFQKHQDWLNKMPRVFPHYAVKCNPDINVLKVIAALGGSFDCASKQEIIDVMSCKVPPNRIIFANAMKFPSHIEFAKKVGVELMTADSECELRKIHQIFPKAKIVIRIRCDAVVAEHIPIANLGKKFGCNPGEDAVNLIKITMNLGLDLYGFSFHVGSPCGEVSALCRGIIICNNLIETARSMGFKNVNMIDIGGGIPGESDFILDEFSEPINETLKLIDSSIKIIAEPGRYYVTSAFSSAALIIGKKMENHEGNKSFMYYLSDGVYGSFIEELLDIRARDPVPLDESLKRSVQKYPSTIWGPTCDSYDRLVENHLLPEFETGEWVGFFDMGSYSTCLSSNFNGFNVPKIYPIARKSEWEKILNEIKKKGLVKIVDRAY